MTRAVQRTEAIKWMIVLRIAAGAPLLFFGVMHLIGTMPMRPLLEAAALPAPGLMATLAPLAQIAAGASLLAGVFARLGGVLAVGTMLGAIFTHLKIPNDQWPVPTTDAAEGPWPEPMFLMYVAIVIVLLSVIVIWKGAGGFSFDARASSTERAG